MSKIIGVTVGTPIGVDKLKEKIKPVTSVDGVKADENGDVKVQRTHWKEVIGEDAEIVSLQSATFSALGWASVTGVSNGMKEGVWYTGTIGGLAFEGRCKKHGYELYIGNGHMLDSALEDTGEFFCINALSDTIYQFTIKKPAVGSSLKFELRSVQEVTWHKLDKNYLPDDLGGVKTVNGQTPDENGNVEIATGGSGGVTSWNDLTDKPFGKTGSLLGTAVGSNGGSTLTWDGDIINTPGQGEDGSGVANRLCRVSKIAPELDTVGNNGGTLVFKVIDASGTVQTIEEDINRSNIHWESIGDNGNTRLRYTNFDYEELSVLLIYAATSYDFGNSTYVLEPGVYFTYWHFVGSKEYYAAGITVNGYTGFAQTVETIDPIYLPPDLGDYNKLKNRPFGSDGVQMVEIFPETTVEIAPGEESAGFAATVPLVEGQTYTVKYNGVEYECICSSFTAEILVYGLGNIGAMMGGNDTGEPFIFLSAPVEGVCGVFALDGSASVTLSISGETEIIDKMEGKFLPEGAPYIEPFDDVILPETVLDDVMLDSSSSLTKNLNLPVSGLIPGNIYNIILDGRLYSAKAYALVSDGGFSVIALGSGFLDELVMPGLPYTDAPFALMFIQDAAIVQAFGFNVQMKWRGDFEAERMAIVGGKAVRQIDEACLPQCTAPLLLTLTGDEGGYTPDRTRGEVLAAVRAKVPVWVSVIEPAGVNQFGLFPMNAWYDYGSLRFGFFDGAVYHNFEWNSDDAFVHEKIHWTDADLQTIVNEVIAALPIYNGDVESA